MHSGETPPADALTDVVELLEDCPAFVGVPPDRLERLAAGVELAYCPQGEPVDDVVAARPLVVVRGGLRVADDRGHWVDLVGPGEFRAGDARERLQAMEPTLVALLPDDSAELAWSAPPELLHRFAAGARADTVDLQTAPVRSAMTPGLVTVDASATCRQAAQVMRERGISAVVVTGGAEPGILTDRDLRGRLVAAGRSAEDPVAAVATFPVRTVEASTPQFEALVDMLAEGIHHLPVVEGGRMVGMLTSSDLLRVQTRHPLRLRKDLDRAGSVDEVAAVVATLPESAASLLDAGTTAGDTCRLLTTVGDRAVARLLHLAEAALGAPPGPYGWLAFGSQGRLERTLGGDQDTGLVFADDLAAGARTWCARLGAWMTAALETCGYPRCPGGVMAERDDWRRAAGEWRDWFARLLEQPTEEHLLKVDIAFDLRTAAGQLEAEPLLHPVVATAPRHGVFLARLARDAVRQRPPLGFLGRFAVARSGEHEGAFDIKAGALLPIADLARFHALAGGVVATGTQARLAAAGGSGAVSADLVATLREGYELALRVRLEHQLALHAAGAPRDSWVRPADLSPLVRSQLRETFKAVRVAQDSLSAEFHTGWLG